MRPKHLSHPRLFLLRLVVLLFWLVGLARLVQVQLFLHPRALAMAQSQAEGWVTIPAKRGEIFDCTGLNLVSNRPRASFAVIPERWEDRTSQKVAAGKLARLCGDRQEVWLKRFRDHPQFLYVARDADLRTAAALRTWDMGNLLEVPDPGRMYPTGQVGESLLGAIDLDGKGRGGLELAYDEWLKDRPARGRVRVDALRSAYIDPLPSSLAKDGNDLRLTLNWTWQQIAEEELQKLVALTKAKGGGAIFMNPEGAIRVLAYVSAKDEPGNVARCRPVSDLFEPGSIFKAITAAILLSEHRVKLEDSVYADSGLAYFDGRAIRDSEPHLWLSFAQSFSLSSNIAFGKWAQRLDGPDWYRRLRDFGFGRATGVGLSAEPDGQIPNPKRWTTLAKAQLAMGHSVSVTALQMVSAFAVFANGGDLYRPYMVEAAISPEGDTLFSGQPQKLRHLVTPEVVQTMGQLLVSVVTEGTAKPAFRESISIAGKTGTAQKVREDGKGYHQNRFISSFVGYFPADAPQVVGMIYLDEPLTNHYGGWTAAPAFARIAEYLAGLHPEFLRYPDQGPDLRDLAELPDPPPTPGIVPDVRGLPLARATLCLARTGYQALVQGTGMVDTQVPEAGAALGQGGIVQLLALPPVPPKAAEEVEEEKSAG